MSAQPGRLLIVFAAVVVATVIALPASGQPCGSQEIVLRDSIGIGSASTDGSVGFHDWQTAGSGATWYLLPFTVQAPRDLLLAMFRMIGAQTECHNYPDCSFSFSYYSHHFMAWLDWTDYSASPEHGTIVDQWFATPTIGPTQFGLTGVDPDFGLIVPTWDMSFDLTPANLMIPAGQSRVVGLQVKFENPDATWFGIVESTEQGSPDYACDYFDLPPSSCYDLSQSYRSQHSGRAAIKITAMSIGPMRGDINGDGALNAADVSPFAAILLDPAGATPAQRCAADMDQSGVVDGADIRPFVSALLHP